MPVIELTKQMQIIFQYSSDMSFTKGLIQHATLQSHYSDVYFYIFSYSGALGNDYKLPSYPGKDNDS